MDNNVVSNALKDSLVICRSSLKQEVRGRLVKFTRTAASFEIFSPDIDLRVSEILTDFTIIFHERALYSGKATVNALVGVGHSLLCSATLEEASWKDLQPGEEALT